MFFPEIFEFYIRVGIDHKVLEAIAVSHQRFLVKKRDRGKILVDYFLGLPIILKAFLRVQDLLAFSNNVDNCRFR